MTSTAAPTAASDERHDARNLSGPLTTDEITDLRTDTDVEQSRSGRNRGNEANDEGGRFEEHF